MNLVHTAIGTPRGHRVADLVAQPEGLCREPLSRQALGLAVRDVVLIELQRCPRRCIEDGVLVVNEEVAGRLVGLPATVSDVDRLAQRNVDADHLGVSADDIGERRMDSRVADAAAGELHDEPTTLAAVDADDAHRYVRARSVERIRRRPIGR